MKVCYLFFCIEDGGSLWVGYRGAPGVLKHHDFYILSAWQSCGTVFMTTRWYSNWARFSKMVFCRYGVMVSWRQSAKTTDLNFDWEHICPVYWSSVLTDDWYCNGYKLCFTTRWFVSTRFLGRPHWRTYQEEREKISPDF